MKKQIIFLMAILIACLSAFSQERKPEVGDWGIGFRLTGIDNITFSGNNGGFGTTYIDVRNVMNDNLVLRIGFGVDVNSITNTTSATDTTGGSTTTTETEYKLSQTAFYIAPGLEYHFTGSDRIDAYVGASLPFGLQTSEKDFNSTSVTGSSFSSLNEQTVINPGGLLLGLQGFLGFNYFFTEKFAIGAEYGLGFNYANLGGEQSTENKSSTTVGGTTTSSFSKTTTDVSRNSLNVGVSSTAGIGVLIFF